MSVRAEHRRGRAELARAMARGRGGLWAAALFSVFVNLLMLTGPLFMLQVYDRVLSSRSEATLTALFVLVAALFAVMGVLEYARGRIAARLGASFQHGLDSRVFEAAMARAARGTHASDPRELSDLEAVQRLMTSPALFSFFDMPWTPVFVAAIFIFHPLLGVLALAGGLVLVGVALLNQFTSRNHGLRASLTSRQADAMATALSREGEMLRGLGMQAAAGARWRMARDAALDAQLAAADRTGGFSSFSKVFRLFLQSAMLAAGAWLVLRDQLTPGAMIAASIILGRALAPVEQAIGNWPLVQRAREGWQELAHLLGSTPPTPARTALPRPSAILELAQVTALPPGHNSAALRMLSMRLEPGQALGVIGPSGAGKSTLARVLTGVWAPASGKVRLDGATLDQYGPEALARHIGYLPQDVHLLDATIAENIARLDPDPDPDMVVEAARKAGAHDLIKRLPQGYDTRIGSLGGQVSGGQRQRIGLARALYGNPVILVLDEPNSSLDAEGSGALNQTIREMCAAGGAVVIMSHRPSGIAECDRVLVLQDGSARAFGPRDEVLRSQLQNYAQVAQGLGAPAITPAPAAAIPAATGSGA